MNTFEFIAKTSDEAIKNGLEQLNTTIDKVEVEILEEGGGFLGLKKAKVKITKKSTDGERAVTFLNGLLLKMNSTSTCALIEENEKILISLKGADSPSLIGYRGEVLDSVQTLASAVANTGREKYRRVVVDCENYREKREETLVSLANKLAQKAVRTGRKVSLEPMNPYERRVIHAALSDNTEVKTLSDGKESARHITIIPNNLRFKDDKPFRENRNNFENKGNFSRPFNQSNYNRPSTTSSNTESRIVKELIPNTNTVQNTTKLADGEKRPYFNDRKPYEKPGYDRPNYDRKPFDGEKRPIDGAKKDEPFVKQFNSGFKRPQTTSSARNTEFSGFGTYLGNSRENTENSDNNENSEN